MKIEIIPTILTKDSEEVLKKVKLLEGVSERFQFDLIDGIFLPEKSVGLDTLAEVETSLKIDVHLMTNQPEEWVERAVEAMADRIIGQVEKMDSCQEFIEQVVGAGVEVGLALSPETPVLQIEENLSSLDLVLVMTRKPGFGKFPFDEKTLKKVEKIRKLSGEHLGICVDGGINDKNIRRCVSAGANLFAIGGALWGAKDIGAEIEKLKKSAQG